MKEDNDEELRNVLDLLEKEEENENVINKKDEIVIEDLIKTMSIKYAVYGVIFGFLLQILLSFLETVITSSISIIIIELVLSLGVSLGICKLSINSTLKEQSFKEQIINKNNIHKIMKRLMILSIILCIINCLSLFSQVNTIINETAAQIDILSSYGDNNENVSQLNATKNSVYFQLVIAIIGYIAIVFIIWRFIKKEISRYFVE